LFGLAASRALGQRTAPRFRRCRSCSKGEIGAHLRYEGASGSGRSGVHVAAAVDVLIDLDCGADYPPIKENRENCGLKTAFGDLAGLVVLPEQGQQQGRDDRIDMDAKDEDAAPTS
jgi:hypothetical protein